MVMRLKEIVWSLTSCSLPSMGSTMENPIYVQGVLANQDAQDSVEKVGLFLPYNSDNCVGNRNALKSFLMRMFLPDATST